MNKSSLYPLPYGTELEVELFQVDKRDLPIMTPRMPLRLLVLSLFALAYDVSALSQPQPRQQHQRPKIKSPVQRRHFLDASILSTIAACAAFTMQPESAVADLSSAAASGVPLLGRFEQLKGANAFIGSWKYECTKGIPQGELVFLKNGDVELRSVDDSSVIIGVGAVPWKYVSPKGADTVVTISFTLDEDGQDDVLIFQGTLDTVNAAGPDRIMEGSIATGRAEIGARGSGPMRRVGSFKAIPMQ